MPLVGFLEVWALSLFTPGLFFAATLFTATSTVCSRSSMEIPFFIAFLTTLSSFFTAFFLTLLEFFFAMPHFLACMMPRRATRLLDSGRLSEDSYRSSTDAATALGIGITPLDVESQAVQQ